MSFHCQVSRALDDEHRANLDLLGRVEQAFARPGTAGLADPARILVRHVEAEIGRHFNFEERELFPRMSEAGDGDMAALMIEEHEAIRAVCAELLPLARAAAAGTLADADFGTLKRGVMELVERQVAHIQKETMALLPLLDDLLDDETDRELAFAYAT
ncbi:MAG: hemerythrin domain-containing protein [Burkholderiales bacterium]|nr:hemerythrin domain-containing protein [Burkholderiales bacterium]